MWVLTDPDGNIYAYFDNVFEASEATYTGDFPEDAEVGFLN